MRRKRMLKRVLSFFLAALMLCSVVPASIFAYWSDEEKPATIIGSDGQTIAVTDDWEETFPYGTFAFAQSQTVVEEGGGETVIKLYRLGGTKGKAVAYVTYMPAAAEMEDGVMSYANAAGAGDIVIRVEDPLPIVHYQALGKAPDPEVGSAALAVEPYTGEGALDGDLRVTLDAAADAYQWYLWDGAEWNAVKGATDAEFILSAEEYEAYDLRCVYTDGGVSYCTASVKGTAYVKAEPEALEEMPEDLELNPEISYTAVEMDAEKPYQGYVFNVTFAEDEWVKEIRVSAPDDDVAEPVKGGYFTIIGCDGGSLYDSANTLALLVNDDEKPEDSQLGFAVTEILADKAEGKAVLTVVRTGGTQNVVTVEYATKDGTAAAGEDYLAVSGSLAFYADVTEQKIEIPLMNDGIVSADAVDFTVTLSNVRGDGDASCALTADTAVVRLYNTSDVAGGNLASVLRDGEAVDVSGGVTVEAGSTAPVSPSAVTGTQNAQADAPLTAEIVFPSESELEPHTYTYPQIVVRRSDYGNYNSAYWRDWAYVANNETYGGDINAVGGFTTTSWSGGKRHGSGGWAVVGSSPASALLNIPNMASMYSSYKGSYDFDIAPYKNDLYGAEFIYPWASAYKTDGTNHAYVRSDVTWDWGFFSGYTYTYYTGGSLSTSWDMSTAMAGLKIGLSKHDSKNGSSDAYCELEKGALQRRSFANNFGLRIYTANDSDSAGDAAVLETTSGVYQDIKPEVKVVSGQGGVTTGGRFYVGTKLQVTLKSTDSYFPLTGESLTSAVYLTDSSGNRVNVSITPVSGTTNSYYVTLLWNNMTEAQLKDTYTLNVVMTRKQDVKLDVGPSVDRKTDDNGNPLAEIDATKIGGAWDRFWNSPANASNNVITYGYTPSKETPNHFEAIKTMSVSQSGLTQDQETNTAKLISGLQNLQWINFNRSAEDRILYNGRIYAGNETIWLDMSDLALKNATFRYYHRDFLSASSIMTADVNSIGLYLDVNGNGRIDGYYDMLTGYFRLDEGTEDQFIMFLDKNMDYDESLFAPVPVEWNADGSVKKYAQYFAKIFYTMTPRALYPADSTHNDDRAQVLPAFVTNVTDPDEYGRLTAEQKAYRYIISGLNRTKDKNGKMSDYARSADGHLMYGAEAGLPQIIDIPLGGDVNPPTISSDGKSFVWTPDYQGNLLYPFENPEPVYIQNSLAGPNIPVADDFTVNADGSFTLSGDAAAKLNGYLGAFTANQTFALCIQEQKNTTEEIAAANGVDIGGDLALAESVAPPQPESSNLTYRGSFPNSDYLKAMESGGAMDAPSADMEESDSDFEEFEVDLGIQLPSAEIGVTDYVSVVMDGYEVGFSIGIPLGGYNSNGDAGAGGVGGGGGGGGGGGNDEGSNWVSPKAANAANAEDMGKLKDFLKSPSRDTFAATDDSLQSAWDDGEMKSSGFEVGFSVAVAFLFKYNSVDNTYYFSQFSIAVSAELEYKYQYRLTPCPIVYLYVSVGFGVELGTGATVERETVEETTPAIDSAKAGSAVTLKKGEVYTFDPQNRKAFNIDFDGKLAIELLKLDTNDNKYKLVDGSVRGFLSSEGGDTITATMLKKDGMEIGDGTYRIRLTALENTTVKHLARIEKMETKNYWSGFSLSPEGYIEAGAGIGVEILKFEVFIKINIGCSMTFGGWDEDAEKYTPFSFDSFEFGLGLGFRVVLLVFNYEMDLIGYKIEYDGEEDKWTHSWSALGDLFGDEIGELSAVDSEGGTHGVRVTLPGYTGKTQTIYSGGHEDELSPLAYDANDALVPFQLSGYGSSGDAFKLVDGLITGYDYQVVTVGTDNYLVYTISRANAAHAVDNTMLVLSRLRLTAVPDGEGTRDEYGLVNPLDADDPTPYIVLDDDGTGDLDFDVWTEGTTIHAAWVSYASVSTPAAVGEKPQTAKPQLPDGTPMDETNYKNPAFRPAEVSDPGAEPVQGDFYLTVAEFEALTEAEEKARYIAVTDGAAEPVILFYSVTNADGDAAEYATQAAAEAAFAGAKSAYAEAKAAYDAYTEALAAYNAWVNYFTGLENYNAWVQQVANNAAKNTVVKTAAYDTAESIGFTDPVVVSGNTGAHVFLPNGAGDGVTVFAKAEHMSDEERADAAAGYETYLKNIGYDPNAAAEAEAQIGTFRLTYQQGLWDAYGQGTSLVVAAGGKTAELPLAAGQTLDQFEVTKIGDAWYVAYTTSEVRYVDAAGDAVADAAAAVDRLTVKRLFLRTFTMDGDGNVTWTNHGENGEETKALLLRTMYDYDVGGDTRKDGLYKNGATTEYNDPYFANLQFLNGKLGDSLKGESEDFELAGTAVPEDFLLFEMNGSTFVIREDSLKSIVTEKKGAIIPFFAYKEMAGAEVAQSTGRSEVTIGTDGEGNIAAVYVATVPNTTNNAIYLSKYDPSSSTWGAGVMLAMNYMQVYEDAIANGWNAEDTEQAYLGQLNGYADGGMDQFVFSNLQIALGQSKGAADLDTQGETAQVSTMARGEALELLEGTPLPAQASEQTQIDLEGVLSAAQLDLLEEIDAANAGRDTLLVITQGTMSYLKQWENGGETLLAPMNKSEEQSLYEQYRQDGSPKANRVPGVGVYAISYGVGGQAIGEGELSFVNYDFTAGSKLNAALSFTNTGDVGIRASAEQPAVVKLMARFPDATGTADLELASWQITQNVAAGQSVRLNGEFTLTETLPTGSVLYAAVAENDFYLGQGGVPFAGETDLLTIAEKPELAFESGSIVPESVADDGDTVLAVDLHVGNRGNTAAKDVFVQFSYDTGATDPETGAPVYAPLDISDNTLYVTEEEELETQAVEANDLRNGIFFLYNPKDGGDIRAGYGRHLRGTVTVPASLYAGALTGSLNIRVEIFSAADNTSAWTAGLISAVHGEYNTANNVTEKHIEHRTFFDTAEKVTLALGNTMRLPVTVTTTTGSTVPFITVQEFPEGGSAHMGILAYDAGGYADGRGGGAVVLVPKSTGNGYIRVTDVNTNSFYDVAYIVTEPAEGINIFNDNEMFSFINKNGSAYDPTVEAGTQDWLFDKNATVWGSGANANRPYLDDLSRGKVGAQITFQTQAQSIELFFNGKIRVESTFPNFNGAELSASGGSDSQTVRFGANTTNYTHTVTITVLEAAGMGLYADFDRLVETFGTEEPPTPAEDSTDPHIYWSRSFPDIASIQTGTETVQISAYIFDDGALSAVTCNGETPANLIKHTDGFWEVPMEVSANGELVLSATDSAGNRTAHSVTVSWFADTTTVGASAEAPSLDAKLVKQIEEDTFVDLTSQTSFKIGDKAFIEAQADADAAVTASRLAAAEAGLEETPVDANTDGRFPAANNGWYLIRAEKDGRWTLKVITMDRIDLSVPTVTLTRKTSTEMGQQTEAVTANGDPILTWSAQKETQTGATLVTIDTVTINGHAITITPNQTWLSGDWVATYGGLYTLAATDTSGNKNEAAYTLADVKIKLAEGKTLADLYTVVNARGGNEGSITLDAGAAEKALVGGLYDEDASNPATGLYAGRYEWQLIRSETALTGNALAALLADDSQWKTGGQVCSGLSAGVYMLYVRDANEPRNAESATVFPILVGEEAVTLTLEKQVDADTGAVSLAWSAAKGLGALEKITSVKINGYELLTEPTQNASGSFAITHAGSYVLKSVGEIGGDKDTATKAVTLLSEEMPVALAAGGALIRVNNVLIDSDDAEKALFTLDNPWMAAGADGRIAIDKTLLVGGEYASGNSVTAENRYAGDYEWRLLTIAAYDTEELIASLKADWLAQNPGMTEEDITEAIMSELLRSYEREQGEALIVSATEWSQEASYEGLTAGRYTVEIRDRLDPKQANVYSNRIVLENEYVKYTAEAKPASSYTADDAVVTVQAAGGVGKGGTYQFIIRPIEGENAALLGVQELPTAVTPVDPDRFGEWGGSAWQIADPAGAAFDTGVFSGLSTGWYQIAVRPMLGVDAEAPENPADSQGNMEALFALYETFAGAQKEFNAAQTGNTESGIRLAAQRLEKEIDAALQAWRRADAGEKAAAYEAYKAAVGNDQTVLDALSAWEQTGFSNRGKTDYLTAVRGYTAERAAAEAQQRFDAAEADLTAKQSAYETELARLNAITDQYYEDHPEAWGNATTDRFYVPYFYVGGQIMPYDLIYEDDGTVVAPYSATKLTLHEDTRKLLIERNQTQNVILRSSSVFVLIPAGTLAEDDDVDAMKMHFVALTGDAENAVVRWTGENGESELVAWSYVTDTSVSYIAFRAGTYDIVYHPVSFNDVPDTHWGADEVLFTGVREMFEGIGGNRFDPTGTMSRAMFVTVLGRLAGIDTEAYDRKVFDDVDPGKWYGAYVAWAAENGIVNGVGNNRFDPDAPVTREQICTMLIRYLDAFGFALPEGGAQTAFPDEGQIGAWALESVRRFQSLNIVEGNEHGFFLPKRNASRAEAAAIYARLIITIFEAYGA